MDLGIHEGVEIPMPMSCNFTPIHEVSKLKMLTVNENGTTGGSNGTSMEELRQPFELKLKKAIRYRECQKNHAANLGGHATDGCGEFMPSGGEGTLEALKCAACGCHRNFHRQEVEGEPLCELCHHGRKDGKRPALLIPSPHAPLVLPHNPHFSRPPSQMIMALSTGFADSDDQEGGLLSPPSSHMKKRFRTKFTAEQKQKMCSFAEKVGWRMQKHDEAAVQQFCSEIGVRRHVLKVWMHNNKHVKTKNM